MSENTEQKASIALCTYNGERFLQEQLESIAAQTVVPFELVICDDMSSDSTKDILKNFAAKANFPVRLYFNSENLGYVKNFEKAISLCKGEIIFLCDQDDVWRTDKIEVMQKYFCDPEIGMVFSNADIIDSSGKHIGMTLWEKVCLHSNYQTQLNSKTGYRILFRKPLISGCTMAFRADLWCFISPIPTNICFIHDGWIAFWVSMFKSIKPIQEKLQKYRLHQAQRSDYANDKRSLKAKIRSTILREKKEQYNKQFSQLKIISTRTQEYDKYLCEPRKQYVTYHSKEYKEHLLNRLSNSNEVPFLKRLNNVARELKSGRYHSYSQGYRSAFLDIFFGL